MDDCNGLPGNSGTVGPILFRIYTEDPCSSAPLVCKTASKVSIHEMKINRQWQRACARIVTLCINFNTCFISDLNPATDLTKRISATSILLLVFVTVQTSDPALPLSYTILEYPSRNVFFCLLFYCAIYLFSRILSRSVLFCFKHLTVRSLTHLHVTVTYQLPAGTARLTAKRYKTFPIRVK
jgi:hypothetical protein